MKGVLVLLVLGVAVAGIAAFAAPLPKAAPRTAAALGPMTSQL